MLGRSSFGGSVLSAAKACAARLGCGIDGPVKVEIGRADNSEAVEIATVGCEVSRHGGGGASPAVGAVGQARFKDQVEALCQRLHFNGARAQKHA